MSSGKFLIAAGGNYSLGSTGGSADAVIVGHDHTGTVGTGLENIEINTNLTDSTMTVRALAGYQKGRIIINQSGDITEETVKLTSKPATVCG
jgi:hypothetical protein